MSLQIWLPLNGHSNNYGMLGNEAITVASTLSYIDNGRCGSALAGGGLTLTASSAAKILNNKEVTIAFWIYPLGTGYGVIFGTENMTAPNNRRFTVFQYPNANALHWSWQDENSSTAIISGTVTNAMPTNTWTHVCLTYKNPTNRLYINGELVKTMTATLSSSTYEYSTRLIANNAHRYISDFRLYDNALSPKEVKLLSQGLMLHYTCNDIFPTRSCNLYSGENVAGKCANSSFTVTKLTNERGYNYKLTYTGTGSNNWKYIQFPKLPTYNIGYKYVFSCKIRKNSGNNQNALYLRAARIGNDYETASVNAFAASDNEWHEYSVIAEMPSEHPRSTTVTPLVEFYSANLSTSGTSYAFDFDIKDVQLYECDTAGAAVSTQDFVDRVVYDCSGYKHHGVTTTSTYPKWCGESPRYSGCYQFLGAQQIQKIVNPISSGNPEFSFSFWYKTNNTTTQTVYTARTGVGIGIALFEYGQHFRLDDGSAQGNFTSYTIPTGTWIHVVVTRDSSSKKLYINGELKQTLTNVGDLTNIGKYGTIGASESSDNGVGNGNYLNGYLSDFRIYSTALSAADAKELYEISSSLTNSSTLLLGGELIE